MDCKPSGLPELFNRKILSQAEVTRILRLDTPLINSYISIPTLPSMWVFLFPSLDGRGKGRVEIIFVFPLLLWVSEWIHSGQIRTNPFPQGERELCFLSKQIIIQQNLLTQSSIKFGPFFKLLCIKTQFFQMFHKFCKTVNYIDFLRIRFFSKF